ncbi:MAG: hypothetical protein NVSMB2_09460 [Chloroflexota bacterium]
MRQGVRISRVVPVVMLLVVACAPSAASPPSTTLVGVAAAAPTATAAASAVVPASGLAGASQSATVTRLAIAYSNLIADNLPLWTAKDSGVFERNGLDVDLQYIASTNAMSALLAGQVQVASTGGTEVINSVANGADLVVLATVTPVYSVFLEVRPEIKTIEDLKGKKIAITNPGASFDISTRVLLQYEGFDPDQDVTFVKTGSVANVTAALVSGNVDAGLANVPDTLKIEAAGLHPLFDMAKLGLPASTVVLVAQKSYVDAQHDATQRIVDAVVEALAREKQDRAASVAVLEKYLVNPDQEAMSAAVDYYISNVLPALPVPKPEQFGDARRAAIATNPRAQQVNIEDILAPSFVQSSAQRGLDKR